MSQERDWKKIGQVVEKIRGLGLSYREGAKRYGLKPWVLYSYNKHLKQEAKRAAEGSGKEEVGRVGDNTPLGNAEDHGAALPAGVVDVICSYRRENPSHGFKRIQDTLKAKYLVVVSRKQIRKVLKEASLLESWDSSFDEEERPARGTRRFEAAGPRQMWQMDVTHVYIRNIPVLYLAVIVDDHSRFCVAAELCRDQRGETMIGVLHNACVMHGAPQKLLTDQGSGFYSWSRQQTVFQEYLDDHHIEHVVAEPHHPQSQGKVERLIQTIREELLTKVKMTGFEDAQAQIRSFINSYNMDRPHQGINGQRPVDRFYGVAGEVEAAESQLAGRDLDLERGFVIYKVGEHRVCMVWATAGLQVYLDGKLLQEANGYGREH